MDIKTDLKQQEIKKNPKWQGLIQKEKVDIDVEKSAQISTVVKIL